MQLLYLVLILIAPYVAMSVAGRFIPALACTRRQRARIALSVFFAFTGIGHFIKTAALALMMPPSIPYRVELVYLTGILELLGAIGIWVPRSRRLTGVCLIVMLVAFLPVNIYAAMHRADFGGHELGPVYLLARIPVQLLLISWTYFATELPHLRH
ncbi:MAG TPA: DoxX family protein [Chthoniobacterales bacterium]|nr:DoxX family protein [Chthoniobacterales bacterium]